MVIYSAVFSDDWVSHPRKEAWAMLDVDAIVETTSASYEQGAL
jgi:hypothetical protein